MYNNDKSKQINKKDTRQPKTKGMRKFIKKTEKSTSEIIGKFFLTLKKFLLHIPKNKEECAEMVSNEKQLRAPHTKY